MAEFVSLWDNDDEPPPEEDSPANRCVDKPVDLGEDDEEFDYLMQESKRRKLRGPAGRARRGAAPTKQHDDAIDLADSDSDRELLREARGGGGTAAPPRLPAPPGGRAAGSSRAAPAPQTLASLKSQMLLRQANELQQRIAAARQAAADSDEDDSQELEPSPVVLRGGRAVGTRRRQQQQSAARGGGGGEVDLSGGGSRGASPVSPAAATEEEEGFDFEAEQDDAAGGGGGLPPPPAGDGDRISLRLRSSKGDKLMRMRRGDPFGKLFEAFSAWATGEGWLPAGGAPGLRFVFDGDKLSPGETPEGLDLEGDEIIEILQQVFKASPQGAQAVCRARSSMATTTAAADTSTLASEGASKPCGGRTATAVSVNSSFDSGNIKVVSISSNPGDRVTHDVELHIRPEPYCESDKRSHFMWFNFRVSNVAGEALSVRITNAGQASYPSAWRGYNVCASYDRQHWFRVPTQYDAAAGVLCWAHTPDKGAVYYAYFAPYSYDRHQALVAEMQCHPGVCLEMLGESVDGREMDLLRVGEDAEGKRKIWVIGRQHPGESMAEWFIEGLLRRLVDRHDASARRLLQTCCFYVVPCMCPDGVFRGHLRTNAAGANLNREWATPTAERSPEVLVVRNAMNAAGVDFLVDVHGDEELPYNFLVDNRGIPSWNPRMQALQADLVQAFCAASPDFQAERGYPPASPNSANLSLCSKHVGERFGCLAVTLEQPFKDNANLPDPEQGWSPERSMRLGAAMLDAVLAVAPRLR
ncbi:peptidase carboxypeptidase A [Micractinium conductrix]|uniref:Peptidase carboxypeptidase A n=1 Tax=Micractinium conductrix TaxID=554055 RepID=A0A2P6VHN0_9CHLO|nr:peptidase carboxypeptidase A [Micractinium conductrix]|eukprot:PSC73595.1 peptidase carboxypeptidase A [Micractinium conductrix]